MESPLFYDLLALLKDENDPLLVPINFLKKFAEEGKVLGFTVKKYQEEEDGSAWLATPYFMLYCQPTPKLGRHARHQLNGLQVRIAWSVTGADYIRHMRERLVDRLKTGLNFDAIYITRDDVSAEIGGRIFPMIHNLENSLRRFLTRHFLVELGDDDPAVTIDRQLVELMKKRKNYRDQAEEEEGKMFWQHINSYIQELGFDDLGELVYKPYMADYRLPAAFARVLRDNGNFQLDRAIVKLQRHFAMRLTQHIDAEAFRKDWIAMVGLRNRVAHNNLLNFDELERAQQLYHQIGETIEKMEETLDGFDLLKDEDFFTNTLVANSAQPEAAMVQEQEMPASASTNYGHKIQLAAPKVVKRIELKEDPKDVRRRARLSTQHQQVQEPQLLPEEVRPATFFGFTPITFLAIIQDAMRQNIHDNLGYGYFKNIFCAFRDIKPFVVDTWIKRLQDQDILEVYDFIPEGSEDAIRSLRVLGVGEDKELIHTEE